MDSYQLQAEREVWEAIARNEQPAGRNGHLYRTMDARFAGRCDGCDGRIRRGQPIRYSSLAPRGHKV